MQFNIQDVYVEVELKYFVLQHSSLQGTTIKTVCWKLLVNNTNYICNCE